MISNNERREVAAKIRGNAYGRPFYGTLVANIAGADPVDDEACWKRLADLIDPDNIPDNTDENAHGLSGHCDRDALLGSLSQRLMPEGMEWPRFEDGELARIGDEVKTFNHDQSSHITSIFFDSSGAHIGYRWNGKDDYTTISPSMLKRPRVFDADGVEIRVRDTVWHVKTGREYVVVEPSYGDTVVVRLATYNDAEGEQYAPDQLTHERPDSWERLEEDAGKDCCVYYGKVPWTSCDGCPAFGVEDCNSTMARDLVRRAKKLAGDA